MQMQPLTLPDQNTAMPDLESQAPPVAPLIKPVYSTKVTHLALWFYVAYRLDKLVSKY